MAPKINELPKHIWKENVLPDMLSRMKIKEQYDGENGKSQFRPEISLNDWLALEKYIIDLAPEKLENVEFSEISEQQQFEEISLALDDELGSNLTYLSCENDDIYFGTITGRLGRYSLSRKTSDFLYTGSSPITWFNNENNFELFTEVGILDPSNQVAGSIISALNENIKTIADSLYRPVHTLVHDLNNDGIQELVVSEFGDETGQLTMLISNNGLDYSKKVLLNQAGCIRTLADDVNKDGKTDIVLLTSQGNESVTILYQEEDLNFIAERAIEFSPVYGSSWFEMIDFNNDGSKDIIVVNGDNADKSYVHKPYHGLRIFLNDGLNKFSEAYFYPLYGATRILARDFDRDGDIDFGLISSFPDYDNHPDKSFVYLENLDAENFEFSTQILQNPNLGRWFLMDASDLDNDGDHDMVISSLTYVFTPVPDSLSKKWNNTNIDILVLENKLK